MCYSVLIPLLMCFLFKEYHEEDQNNGIDEVIISVEDFCETKQDRSEVSSHHVSSLKIFAYD